MSKMSAILIYILVAAGCLIAVLLMAIFPPQTGTAQPVSPVTVVYMLRDTPPLITPKADSILSLLNKYTKENIKLIQKKVKGKDTALR